MKFAFIYLSGEVNCKTDRAVISTKGVDMFVVAVNNYAEAVNVAKELADQGVTAIELCAGFGNEGTALVTKAVRGKAIVGSVKFDFHPILGNKSGDELFM